VNVLDLFSGIGGFSLGLERAGLQTVAFCEIEPYCKAVLRKRWPHVPCYEDVRTLTATRLAADGIAVDVICGGFPCQDISVAGKGAGLAGARSGLWSEYSRLIGEVRPRWVIVENVSALLGRGLGDVLGDLAALGYDAEWHCIPAAYVGAPHRRDRIWIVAYPAWDVRAECSPGWAERERAWACGESIAAANAKRDQLRDESGRSRRTSGADPPEFGDDGTQGSLADASGWKRKHSASTVAGE
jgi:DNA (cytosine-5)-methyltransferase 1